MINGKRKYKEPVTPYTSNLSELPDGWGCGTTVRASHWSYIDERTSHLKWINDLDSEGKGTPFYKISDMNKPRNEKGHASRSNIAL